MKLRHLYNIIFRIDNWFVEILSYYGRGDLTLLELWTENWQKNDQSRNAGITILPLYFWKYLGYSNKRLGFQNKRLYVGLGLFSFYFDYSDLTTP